MREGKTNLVRIAANMQEEYKYEGGSPDDDYMIHLLNFVLLVPSMIPLFDLWDGENDPEERLKIWEIVCDLKDGFEKVIQKGS